MITNPARIAVQGDIHGNRNHAVAAVRWASEQGADVIVNVGDFAFNFDPKFVTALDAVSTEFNLPVMFIRGNHDNTEYLRNLPKNSDGTGRVTDNISWITQGMRWTWNGKVWMGLGGAVSVDKLYPHRVEGLSWWPDETMTTGDCYTAVEGGKVDYLVSHDAPSGVVIPGISNKPTKTNYNPRDFFWPIEVLEESWAHQDMLAQVVDEVKPEILFHGHFHVRYAAMREDTTIIGLDMDGTPMRRNMILMDSEGVLDYQPSDLAMLEKFGVYSLPHTP